MENKYRSVEAMRFISKLRAMGRRRGGKSLEQEEYTERMARNGRRRLGLKVGKPKP